MRVAILASMVAVAACTATNRGPAWTPPRLTPPGWIHRYDYKTELVVYLRGEYESARVAGAKAYVYLYTDSDTHCLGTRRMMSRPELAPILESARIVMLDAERLKWLHEQGGGSAFDPAGWLPVMARIAADGTLVTPVFLPDLPLYHDDEVYRHSPLAKRRDQVIRRRFVSELQQFLQANNEIRLLVHGLFPQAGNVIGLD